MIRRVTILFTITLKLVKYPGLTLTRKVQNSYKESKDILFKMLKDNLKTWRENSMLQREKDCHGQETKTVTLVLMYSTYMNPENQCKSSCLKMQLDKLILKFSRKTSVGETEK